MKSAFAFARSVGLEVVDAIKFCFFLSFLIGVFDALLFLHFEDGKGC